MQIGSLTEGVDSSGVAQPLYVHQEFLATANSDEGDGCIMISSMRSVDEGTKTTVATTNNDVFAASLGTTVSATVQSVDGSNFTVDAASTFTPTHGLVFITNDSGDLSCGPMHPKRQHLHHRHRFDNNLHCQCFGGNGEATPLGDRHH